MKKILLAIALVVTMGFCANAQTDGFFGQYDNIYDNRGGEGDPSIGLPSSHNLTDDQSSPLGSGLLIMTVLGAGYVVARKRK